MFWGGQFADHQHGTLGDLAAFHKRNAFRVISFEATDPVAKIKEQLPGSHAQSWVDEFFGLYKWKRTITYHKYKQQLFCWDYHRFFPFFPCSCGAIAPRWNTKARAGICVLTL
jgi:hypothetical protein